MGALPNYHTRRDLPPPDITQKAPEQPLSPELIEASRSHPIRGLLLAGLLATLFWGIFFVALYFLLR